jgi:ABC-type lipoprotein release transport system permease subunit
MSFILSMALKNLLRYHRRTLITAVAIAVALAMYIWIDAWLQGMTLQTERNLIRYQTGAYLIMDPDVWEEREQLPLNPGIADAAAVMHALQAAGWTASARISFAAEAFFSEGSLLIHMVGIDPLQDAQVFDLDQSLISGRYLRSGEEAVVVGTLLAERLGAELGDTISLRCRTRHGAFQTMDLEIVGIINSPNPAINGGFGYAPLDLIDEALSMGGEVSEIVVAEPDWKETDQRIGIIATLLEARFPDLEVYSWKDQARGSLSIMRIGTARSTVFLFVALIIAAVGISNTMLMSVSERRREIATMQALGMGRRKIRLAFLLEVGAIGLLGSIGGIALGSALRSDIPRNLQQGNQ